MQVIVVCYCDHLALLPPGADLLAPPRVVLPRQSRGATIDFTLSLDQERRSYLAHPTPSSYDKHKTSEQETGL